MGLAIAGCRGLLPASEIDVTVGPTSAGVYSIPTHSVRLTFRSSGVVDRTCRRYTIRWLEGYKDVDATFVVPAMGTTVRTCEMGYLADARAFEQTATVTVFCDRPR